MNARDRSAQADHIAMAGGGAYSLATRGAKDVIDAATPMVLDAIERMELPRTRKRFHMMDIGCADGGTSLDMVRAALTRVREIAPRADLTITYSDQPRNDFNALVGIVHGLTRFRSYLRDLERVYPLFSASSFYAQAVADGALDLGFSATAMHWLSAKPSNLAAHVHMVGADDAERALFARQAAHDWETILLHRAREMAPGARLVLVNFCRDADGRYLGNTLGDSGGVNMFDLFNQLWRELVESGRIGEAEYTDMTLPQYYRDCDEFSAPLIDAESKCHRAGLRLERIETRVVPCPFAEAFKAHGDAERFADGLIPTLRSWSESVYFGALDPARPMPERRRIINDYYAAYRERVLREPQRHGMGYVHAYKTIRKV
ncbi:MAG: SAM-dependent methyltransferase [bacterium]